MVVHMVDGSELDALAYVWNGGTDAVTDEVWDLDILNPKGLTLGLNSSVEWNLLVHESLSKRNHVATATASRVVVQR